MEHSKKLGLSGATLLIASALTFGVALIYLGSGDPFNRRVAFKTNDSPLPTNT